MIKHPPLRYHGSKWRLAPWIISHFPAHRTYCEPFAGGAGVLLRKIPSEVEIYNDLDATGRQLLPRGPRSPGRTHDPAPAHALRPRRSRRLPRTVGQSHRGRPPLLRGLVATVRRRARPMAHRFPRPTPRLSQLHDRHLATPPAPTPAVAARLRRVHIENLDAIECIRRYDSPSTLFYLDPPYLPELRSKWRKTAYRHEATPADHAQLATVLQQIAGMAIVSAIRHASTPTCTPAGPASPPPPAPTAASRSPSRCGSRRTPPRSPKPVCSHPRASHASMTDHPATYTDALLPIMAGLLPPGRSRSSIPSAGQARSRACSSGFPKRNSSATKSKRNGPTRPARPAVAASPATPAIWPMAATPSMRSAPAPPTATAWPITTTPKNAAAAASDKANGAHFTTWPKMTRATTTPIPNASNPSSPAQPATAPAAHTYTRHTYRHALGRPLTPGNSGATAMGRRVPRAARARSGPNAAAC